MLLDYCLLWTPSCCFTQPGRNISVDSVIYHIYHPMKDDACFKKTVQNSTANVTPTQYVNLNTVPILTLTELQIL